MNEPKPAHQSAFSRPPGRSAERAGAQLTFAAAVLATVAVCFGVLAAQPIYATGMLWVVASVGAGAALLVVWIGARMRWGAMTLAALALAFVVLVLPLGVPTALQAGPEAWLRGLGDGLAAVALGWKQLLTLSLPVGTYQAVLVPFLVVMFGPVAAATALVLRTTRWRPFAALAIVAPVLFGTVFGSSAVSDPVTFAGITINAPRELAIWLGAFGTAVAWVAWASGRKRRAALRRGRLADAGLGDEHVAGHVVQAARGEAHAPSRGAVRRNALVRGFVAGVIVVAALAGAFVLAPIVTDEIRTVPRDAVDPELVVRDRVSPLASYRSWKRDAKLEAPMFAVSSSDGQLPQRLSLAVLSGYEGIDFTVGDPSLVGRFTRFPSGGKIEDPHRVTVKVAEGYSDVWVPISAPLAAPPSFAGPRASTLADSFYLNRETGSAVVVSASGGLRDGDSFTATMSGSPAAKLGTAPVSTSPLVDLESMPQLERWLALQELPATGDGVTEAIDRLRERGYLSHSLTDGEGEGAWLRSLGAENPIRFVSSPGGHSEARLEQLFQQLSDQQVAAGEDPDASMLVAGIGDDEQFAAAAAVVARAMGFDSRVVVGVRLAGTDSSNSTEPSNSTESGVPGVPACTEVCTGEHLAAWVEVQGRDGVWAPFDVSPQIDMAPTMLQKGEKLPEFPTQPEERNANESDPPLGMVNQESGSSAEDEPNMLSELWPVLRFLALFTLGGALIALFVLFVPLVKMLRTKKRRAALAPEVQALGAWDELLDAFADTGARVTPGHGRELAMHELGVDGGDWIAWTVDQAVFAREGITAETAQALWEVVDARVSERRSELGFWLRMRSRFSFASFGENVGTGFIRAAGRRIRKKEALR